jgi:hypothetical protein
MLRIEIATSHPLTASLLRHAKMSYTPTQKRLALQKLSICSRPASEAGQFVANVSMTAAAFAGPLRCVQFGMPVSRLFLVAAYTDAEHATFIEQHDKFSSRIVAQFT